MTTARHSPFEGDRIGDDGPTRALSATAGTLRAAQYWLTHYLQTWRGNLVSTFIEPVLYLLAFGLGVGALIEERGTAATGGPDFVGLSYVDYFAPGLLAAAVMMAVFFEAAWSVLGGMQYWYGYKAQSTSPLTVAQIIGGHQLFMAGRAMFNATVFVGVMFAFGAPQSAMVFLTIPLAAIVVWSISGPMAAYSVSRDSDATFPAVNRFVIQPMFLFSGTFFPVDQFPTAVAWVARATPLWHGVQVFRSLSLGTAELVPSLGHIAYLLMWFAVGIAFCLRAYPKPLQT